MSNSFDKQDFGKSMIFFLVFKKKRNAKLTSTYKIGNIITMYYFASTLWTELTFFELMTFKILRSYYLALKF